MQATTDANSDAREPAGSSRDGLPDALLVRGADAPRFLQAQLTIDIDQSADTGPTAFSWCNPQGRVLASGWLLNRNPEFVLLLADSRGTDVGQALQRYVLRDQVSLDPDRLKVAPGETIAGENLSLPGVPPRHFQLLDTAGPAIDAAQAAAWQLAGIRAGVCELPAALAGRWLPQMLNLDLMDGVSFSKGCYPGQEIIARTYHLGKVKRRLFRFATDASAPSPGTDILLGERKVGTVVVSAQADQGSELLAVVELEHGRSRLQLASDLQIELAPLPVPYEIPTG